MKNAFLTFFSSRKTGMVFLLLLFFPSFSFSQNYFQQEVNYKINVRLDDVKHELFADETLEYTNNSPDKLSFLYIHLWANAYKDNSTALVKQMLENGDTKLYFARDEQRGYIDQFDFKVNNKNVKWEYDSANIDICKIILEQPLKSGEKIIISTPFHVKIPECIFSRLGHDFQSYQITQWYPKPAVYDRNGWNQMPYLHQGEFYSEFGSYDVSITVPKNYVVGATGDLVDGERELAWLEKKSEQTKAMFSEEEFAINPEKSEQKSKIKNLSFPLSDTDTKTLHFKQTRVHDFTWFADKRYHVLKGEVGLPHSKRKVTTWTMFTDAQKNYWKNSIEYMNDAIYYYSLWNGDYPYNQATAVDGALSAGAGMEYPNITVIGTSGSTFELEVVIAHEVGHNWFYGVLGSNERKYPWMDEGINSFYQNRYIATKYPIDEFRIRSMNIVGLLMNIGNFDFKALSELTYLISARKRLDQSVDLPAMHYTEINYEGIVYGKAALALDYLKAYLGDSLFDKCMQQYFETWKFKHPQPDDFQKVFTEVTGKNLDWFFNDLLKTTKQLDYKIFTHQGKEITIQNTGEIKSPFTVSGMKEGKVGYTKWFDGFEGEKNIDFPIGLLDIPSMQYDAYRIDALSDMPEINRKNNTLRTHGFFRKVEPLKFQFLGGMENPERTQIFYSPVFGWNHYNKTMLGLVFYNGLLPAKKFEYVLMPLYSFGENNINGSANINYSWYLTHSVFQNIKLEMEYKKYSYGDNPFVLNYQKVAPALHFTLRKKETRSPIKHAFIFRTIIVNKEEVKYTKVETQNFVSLKREKINNNYVINDLKYQFINKTTLAPHNAIVDIQQGEGFVKTSLEANYNFIYRGKNRGLDIRLFAGKFIYSNASQVDARFKMGGLMGYADYLFDEVFLDRSGQNQLLSQQFAIRDGGFKISTAVGQTNDWLIALNVKTSIPGRLPIRLFADIGTYSDAKNVSPNNQQLVYDAGVNLSLVHNIIEIYFPFAMSDDIKTNLETNNITYKQTIHFELNLNLLNPLEFIKNVAF